MERKAALKVELLAFLRKDLAAAEQVHRSTREGATHEEARPENAKDTRALEQSYLARGQAQRTIELRSAVAEVEAMSTAPARGCAALGALVTVEEEEEQLVYWLAPHGGGAKLEGGNVQVVTPLSPLGRALIGKEPGDTCDVVLGGKTRGLEILGVE